MDELTKYYNLILPEIRFAQKCNISEAALKKWLLKNFPPPKQEFLNQILNHYGTIN